MTKSSRARRRRIQQGARFASLAVAAFAMPALAFAAEETKTDTIGPWEIEATFKGDKFDRCSINRKLARRHRRDLRAHQRRISRFELDSPNWKLDRGKAYPVKMTLGSLSFDTDVAAEPNSVSMDVKDKKFETGLRSANALNVVAAGATIRVPLDQSTAAFERLEQCVEKNSKGGRNQPFCGSGTSAVTARRVGGQGPNCQQETKAEPKAAPDQDAKASSETQPANPVKSKSARSRRSTVFSAKGRSVPVGPPIKVLTVAR